MNDGMLSQEEIEALLRGETLDDQPINPISESSTRAPLRVEDYLDSIEQDALGEVGNISFGSSATALSTLLGQKVDITTPVITILNRQQLEEEFPHPYIAIQVEYTKGLYGANLLVVKQSDAAIIADLMLGGDGLNPTSGLSEIQLSAVQEAMNQMMGSAATSMSTVFNQKVDISPPKIDLMNIAQNEGTDRLPEDDLLVKVSFRLKIGTLIDSNIMQLFPIRFGKKIVKMLMGEEDEAMAVESPQPPPFQEPVQPPVQQQAQPMFQQPNTYQQQAATSFQEPQTNYAPPPYQTPEQPVNVQQPQFVSFGSSSITQEEARNLNMLLDIPLQVTVELGRTKHYVKDILQLASGSIIELDKLAGEPVDILVNSRLIAKGEVVVIDENFGVRITDIMSQAERLSKLK